jgi:hypothetical protein
MFFQVIKSCQALEAQLVLEEAGCSWLARCPYSWAKPATEKLNDVLSGYITTLKNKQKLDVSSEGPSSRVSDNIDEVIISTKGLRSKRRVSAYFLR